MAGKTECLGTLAVCAGLAGYFLTSTNGCGAKNTPLPEASGLPASTQIVESDENNDRRAEFVAGLLKNGVISRVTVVGSNLDVSTGPAWNKSSLIDREGFLREIAVQYSARNNDVVRVLDGQTGTPIGTFPIEGGGLKFD